jgi:hypothetical protein
VQQEPQDARERAVLLLRATFLPAWRPTASQRLVWTIRGATVLGVLVLIASAVDKPLWEWLNLLIVPAVLAIGGYLFNSSQNRATQAATERRAQDEALQAYLNHMSDMLMPKEDQPSLSGESPPESLRTLARARTLTVLRRLDGERKGRVLQFLQESGLIEGGRFYKEGHSVRINLSGADLSEADLSEADLNGASLRRAHLSRAHLSRAFLNRADLSGADLSGASLTYADLTDTKGVTEKQLAECEALEGATMPDKKTLYGEFSPDGPTFEEWLKSKGRGRMGRTAALRNNSARTSQKPD